LNRILILLLFVATSCNAFFEKKSERVLARVEDEYLYESDIQGVVAPGSLPKDSILITGNYINNWIRQRLVIHQAVKNLTDSQLDFTNQLENYKNSLIIYAYENELVRQKLDTLVTDEEVLAYYEANQQNFLLKDNIVQLQYVKLPLKSSVSKQIKKFLNSDDPDDLDKLAGLCEENASDYYLDSENWLYFNDLIKQIPIKTYNQEEFLKNNRNVEYQDSMYLYLVRFRDFKIKESVSPLTFERQRVRDIIRNKRKLELIGRMQDDLFTEAQRKNIFEIY
jgi:hypothetical protein